MICFAARLVRPYGKWLVRRQSEIVSIVQEGLGAIRVVKAFAQGAFERQRLEAKRVESVAAGAHARRVRSLLGPVVTTRPARAGHDE